MKSSRLIVKGFLAVLVGLPITLVVGFWATVALFTGIASISEVPGVRNIGGGVAIIAWAGSGLLGLTGFWMWIFMPRSAGRMRRVINAVFIIGGIAAASVLAMSEEPVLTTFAIVGIVTGLIVVAWCLKPELRGNPDNMGDGHAGR